jgi:organic hydroperoxide reductase OsmC/OhrA
MGDASLHNPEDMLLASAASCHMLSYLALCARSRIRVLSYVDSPVGTMHHTGHTFQFRDIQLQPSIVIAAGSDAALAVELHTKAHHVCFIAQSVNFPINTTPVIKVEGQSV